VRTCIRTSSQDLNRRRQSSVAHQWVPNCSKMNVVIQAFNSRSDFARVIATYSIPDSSDPNPFGTISSKDSASLTESYSSPFICVKGAVFSQTKTSNLQKGRFERSSPDGELTLLRLRAVPPMQ